LADENLIKFHLPIAHLQFGFDFLISKLEAGGRKKYFYIFRLSRRNAEKIRFI